MTIPSVLESDVCLSVCLSCEHVLSSDHITKAVKNVTQVTVEC